MSYLAALQYSVVWCIRLASVYWEIEKLISIIETENSELLFCALVSAFL